MEGHFQLQIPNVIACAQDNHNNQIVLGNSMILSPTYCPDQTQRNRFILPSPTGSSSSSDFDDAQGHGDNSTRMKTENNTRYTCKRKIDFKSSHENATKTKPKGTARRNERERNRVKTINNCFSELRQHVPHGKRNKKLSKVDTLKAAVEYIQHLQGILQGHDAMTSEQSSHDLNFNYKDCTSNYQTVPSPTGSLPESHLSPGGYSSDSSTEQIQVNVQDIDIFDFSSLFQC